MMSPRLATWYSPAKVNLCLRIVGRRTDGYHFLDSIFAAVDLCDRIDLTVEDLPRGTAPEILVHCDHPDVPADASNLAARAAAGLLASCGVTARVTIAIQKHIAPGAGLGGGSSNAATILLALPPLLTLDVEPGRLHDLAVGLGADVPFFLTGGCARVRGIGERVDVIGGWDGLTLAVVTPPVAVSTGWAFRAYPSERCEGGGEAERLAAGHPLDASTMVNDLEYVVLPAFPMVAHAKSRLLRAGATAAVMSGSGSAVIGLVPDPVAGRAIASEFDTPGEGTRVRFARVIRSGPFVG